jgi:putative ABC transport system permease protein
MNLSIALQALRVNKLRSGLTMLGIIIGVAAVIVMVAVGSGAQTRVKEQIAGLGSNLMILWAGSVTTAGVRGGTGTAQTLVEDDAWTVMREVSEIQVAAPTQRGSGQIVWGNANWLAAIVGATPEYFEARDWNLISGRMFEAGEISSAGKVAIIGQTVARELFGETDPVDQIIRIRGVPFTVIGLLERKGQSMLGQDQDDIVIMPLSTARNKIFGALQGRIGRVSSIFIKAREGVDMKEAEEKVRELLRQRHRLTGNTPDDFSLRNLTEILQVQEAASKVMAILLAAVASVSLLVGGIGIMNIMLVSVTERTREIGLRLAVGARAKDILSQFLVEAITLSTIGGMLGILLGAFGTWLVAELAEWPVNLSIFSILLAVGFSAVIGIFFGYYPARKASDMQPIQALRYE